jgi:RNA polymerase sigma factor (sigma-70 family)
MAERKATQKNRQAQGLALTQNEAHLLRHSTDKNKDEFFRQITPLLQPLKNYIERRLRSAYLFQELRTPIVTSDDLLDDVILEAYRKFETKPKDLTLEMWLYQIANRIVEGYIQRTAPRDARRRSAESLRGRELRTLEELGQVTADTEGEPWLAEDLDDAEYQVPEVSAPTTDETPEERLEKKEQLQMVLDALSDVPQRDLAVFQLHAMEGFSPGEIAKIMNIPPNEVTEIVDRVRKTVLSRLNAAGVDAPKRKAS